MVILLQTGCVKPLAFSRPEADLVDDPTFEIIEGITVPDVVGPAGCGAQALAALLAFDDPTLDAQRLADELPWQDLGASPVDLLLEARSRGATTSIDAGTWDDLREAIAAERPVLIMIDAALEIRTLTRSYDTVPLMHWAIVSGIAVDDDQALLAAPEHRHHVVSRELLEARWARSDHCLIRITGAPRDER